MTQEQIALVPLVASLLSIPSSASTVVRALRDAWRWFRGPAAPASLTLPPSKSARKPSRKSDRSRRRHRLDRMAKLG